MKNFFMWTFNRTCFGQKREGRCRISADAFCVKFAEHMQIKYR